MRSEGTWPINNGEQDTILIKTMVTMLEKMLGAKRGFTGASYWRGGIGDSGGSVELRFVCDYLHGDELRALLDLEKDTPEDGDPAMDVMISYLWDEETRKELLAEWEEELKVYPETLWREYFSVRVMIDFTKKDWDSLVEMAKIERPLVPEEPPEPQTVKAEITTSYVVEG